jgi:hypothetical protein
VVDELMKVGLLCENAKVSDGFKSFHPISTARLRVSWVICPHLR